MKQHTLIYAGVAKDNEHLYNVIIGTDLGQFSGTVECRPEDFAHESKYFGFELAELKAEINYARAKKKYYDAQLKALTQFWREMSATRTYDVDAFWVKKMRERVDEIDNEKNGWAARAEELKLAYYVKIKAFDVMNAKHNRGGGYNND